jgi:Sulfotransferase family
MTASAPAVTDVAPGWGILVTGLPRAGTSWVGKMLQAGRDVVYVNEPLNPQHPPGRSPGVLNAEVSHRFQYICADNDEPWAAAFADTLRLRYRLAAELRRNHGLYDLARLVKYGTAFTAGRFRHRRPLIDDPFAVLSSAWFAERLGCQVVAIVRHPVGFIASRQRLGYQTDLYELLDQPLLVRDLPGRYADEIRALADSPDNIAKAALLWRVTYATLADLAGRLPRRLTLRRYEDLATDPVPQFRELYDVCGLTWTDKVEQQVVAATTGRGNAERRHVWSLRGGLSHTAFRPMESRAALRSYRERLTPEQIDRVLELTADVATRYYREAEGLP